MKIKVFNHSLGHKGFEINFIGKKWNLRIASRQFALWKEPFGVAIFNFCRYKKTKWPERIFPFRRKISS